MIPQFWTQKQEKGDFLNPFPYPGIRRRLRPSRPSSLTDAKGAPVGLW